MKERLLKMEWNSFEQYPEQGSDICLHCSGSDRSTHKFIAIRNFNAVTFDPKKITDDFKAGCDWQFGWLPLDEIEEKNGN